MSKPVTWTRRATRTLTVILHYAADSDPDAAEALRNTIVDRAEQLGHFPQLGPPSLRGTRKLVVTGTPYMLFYRETLERVDIVGLWHHKLRKRG